MARRTPDAVRVLRKRGPRAQHACHNKPRIGRPYEVREACVNPLRLCRLQRLSLYPHATFDMTAAASSRITANRMAPPSAATTPATLSAIITMSPRSQGFRIPMKVGNQRALNPQTNGTMKPHAISTRKRWSKLCGNAGELPCIAALMQPPKLAARVPSKPKVPETTTRIHFSNLGCSCEGLAGLCVETARKNMRNATNSRVAEMGRIARQCHS